MWSWLAGVLAWWWGFSWGGSLPFSGGAGFLFPFSFPLSFFSFLFSFFLSLSFFLPFPVSFRFGFFLFRFFWGSFFFSCSVPFSFPVSIWVGFLVFSSLFVWFGLEGGVATYAGNILNVNEIFSKIGIIKLFTIL